MSVTYCAPGEMLGAEVQELSGQKRGSQEARSQCHHTRPEKNMGLCWSIWEAQGRMVTMDLMTWRTLVREVQRPSERGCYITSWLDQNRGR